MRKKAGKSALLSRTNEILWKQMNNYSASGLAPVSGNHPYVLILGSYPSELSLQRNQYYGNPRNQFWKIMGIIFSFRSDFSDMPYQERLNCLTTQGVAIWDVLESCSREGSSDSSIGDTIPNDIRRFLSDHPSIRCIALNGKTGAGHWFKRYFSDIMNNEDRQVAILPLPSSSPAYAGMSIEKKADIWQQISLFCTKSE